MRWRKFSEYLGHHVSRLGLSPNVYSWATLPVALFAWFAVYRDQIYLGLSLFLCAGLLDIIDGGCARSTNQESCRGAFLDGTLDRVVDFLVLASFFNVPMITLGLAPEHWIFIASFVIIMPSFIVAYANHRGAVDDPSETRVWRLLNRGEIVGLLLSSLLMTQYSPRWGGYLFMLFVILASLTIVQSFCLAWYLSSKTIYP